MKYSSSFSTSAAAAAIAGGGGDGTGESLLTDASSSSSPSLGYYIHFGLCCWSITLWFVMQMFGIVGSSVIQYRYNILRKRNAAVASAAAAAASTQNSVTNNNDTFSSSSISARLPPDLAPPVSILRPLKGIDVNMFENLSSSFCQDYPNFEIIFLVASETDAAIEVVEKLRLAYPHVDSRLLIGAREIGVNPKVNNLSRGFEEAKYDIVWVVDSNIYSDPGCLGRSVDELSKPGVGLVHHLPCGIRPQSFGSCLEMAFLNTAHSKMYTTINFLGPSSCVVGKSNLYRRSDIFKVGGLDMFGKYMSEDNVIATAIWNSGLSHRMTSDLAYQTLGSNSVLDFFNRRARWIRIRKYVVPVATFLEPFTESIFCGVSAAYAFHYMWPAIFTNPVTFFGLHMLVWFTYDTLIMHAVDAEECWRVSYLVAWLVRELCAVHLFIYAVAGNYVEWRGNMFKLRMDGTVEPAGPRLDWSECVTQIRRSSMDLHDEEDIGSEGDEGDGEEEEEEEEDEKKQEEEEHGLLTASQRKRNTKDATHEFKKNDSQHNDNNNNILHHHLAASVAAVSALSTSASASSPLLLSSTSSASSPRRAGNPHYITASSSSSHSKPKRKPSKQHQPPLFGRKRGENNNAAGLLWSWMFSNSSSSSSSPISSSSLHRLNVQEGGGHTLSSFSSTSSLIEDSSTTATSTTNHRSSPISRKKLYHDATPVPLCNISNNNDEAPSSFNSEETSPTLPFSPIHPVHHHHHHHHHNHIDDGESFMSSSTAVYQPHPTHSSLSSLKHVKDLSGGSDGGSNISSNRSQRRRSSSSSTSIVEDA